MQKRSDKNHHSTTFSYLRRYTKCDAHSLEMVQSKCKRERPSMKKVQKGRYFFRRQTHTDIIQKLQTGENCGPSEAVGGKSTPLVARHTVNEEGGPPRSCRKQRTRLNNRRGPLREPSRRVETTYEAGTAAIRSPGTKGRHLCSAPSSAVPELPWGATGAGRDGQNGN